MRIRTAVRPTEIHRYTLAVLGHAQQAARELLRVNADPLLTKMVEGRNLVSLDVVAWNGSSDDVVRELIQYVGIEGCGGPSAGLAALEMAAAKNLMVTTVTLKDFGVVDAGRVLLHDGHGKEGPVKFL